MYIFLVLPFVIQRVFWILRYMTLLLNNCNISLINHKVMFNFLGQALFLITNVKNKLITYVEKHLILI